MAEKQQPQSAFPAETPEEHGKRIYSLMEQAKMEPDRPPERPQIYMGRKKVWGGWGPGKKG